MLQAYIESVGLFAPGLVGWHSSAEVLRGEQAYEYAEAPKYKPALLSGNERRRATTSVRIAFGACEDAIGSREDEATQLAAVFASSGGDYAIHDQICKGLLREEPVVSPTQFHNSVHNAAGGYWGIASNSKAPSTSLSAYDHSVSAGLLEALPIVALEEHATLLVLSDCAVVQPMHQNRDINDPFAAALWLTPRRTSTSMACLTLTLDDNAHPPSEMVCKALEPLRKNNPAAQILPLLEGIAAKRSEAYHFATATTQSVTLQLDCNL
ncbi:MAG: beta-ketoacyl synthase chain length factor [Halioglobus sp.]